MMSAKTVLTDAPATTSGNTINLTSTPAAGSPTEFQSVLAGAAPGVELSFVDTLPTQPLAPLLTLKQQQAAAKAAAANATVPVKAAPPSAAEILKLLNESSALLSGADGATAATPETRDDANADELVEDPEDILQEWMDAMVPASVLAAQAGARQSADESEGAADYLNSGGGGAPSWRASPVPASLLTQAGLPDAPTPTSTSTNVVPTTAQLARVVDVTLATSPVAAAVAALVPHGEATEGDKPSADGWMSSLADLAGKRGVDGTPDLAPRLATPVHDNKWADALAHRLVMMARDGESTAQLKLVPVELGPLDIQITVKDSEATVHFGAAHQETRQALESSLPRLRELLSAQGLQLANASVSQQSGGKNQPERSSGPAAVGAVTEEADVASAKAVSTSLLDLYA
jgi:flagellar hook-length control protein FliK